MPDNTADDITTDIANSATTPVNANVDGTSVTARSIDEKIKAASYAGQNAITSINQLFGNRTRLIPGPRQ